MTEAESQELRRLKAVLENLVFNVKPILTANPHLARSPLAEAVRAAVEALGRPGGPLNG